MRQDISENALKSWLPWRGAYGILVFACAIALPFPVLGQSNSAYTSLIASLQADNNSAESYTDLLLQGVDNLQQVREVESLLLEYLPDGDSNRHRVYWRLAELCELSADLDRSQRYYHAAYQMRAYDDSGVEALYRSASLLLELGDVEEARLQSYTILERSEDAVMRRRVRLLLARSYAMEENYPRALELLDSILQGPTQLAPPMSKVRPYSPCSRLRNGLQTESAARLRWNNCVDCIQIVSRCRRLETSGVDKSGCSQRRRV